MTNTPKEPPQEIQEYIKTHFSYRDGKIDGMLKEDIGYVHYRGKDKKPYKRIVFNFKGEKYQVYRSHIVYFLCTGIWPYLSIDHIDRDTMNDKIDNLICATEMEQMSNRDSRAGGFEVDKRSNGTFRVRNRSTKKYLGVFNTREEAYEAIEEYLKLRE